MRLPSSRSADIWRSCPGAPHAMVSNTALRWRRITDHRIEVSTEVGDCRVADRLAFDGHRNVIRAFIPDRPRWVKGQIVRTPWHGVFGGYETIDGVRIPAFAECAWELPEGMFTYWRAMVSKIRLDP